MELKLCRLRLHKAGYKLLIVPYGIETRLFQVFLVAPAAFNRTLWN